MNFSEEPPLSGWLSINRRRVERALPASARMLKDAGRRLEHTQPGQAVENDRNIGSIGVRGVVLPESQKHLPFVRRQIAEVARRRRWEKIHPRAF